MDTPNEIPPNAAAWQFIEGAPVYDGNNERIGSVSKHGNAENALILHKGGLFHRDTYIPLSAVRSSDANGVHLAITKDHLKHEHYAAPPRAESTGGARLTVLGRAVFERSPHTFAEGVDSIERSPHTFAEGTDSIESQPHTYTQGVDSIESQPHTYTQGVDSIERGPEEP